MQCGTSYYRAPAHARAGKQYCSLTCRDDARRARRPWHDCPGCGTHFQDTPTATRRRRGYCTTECRDQAVAADLEARRAARTCEHCGARRPDQQQRFCSLTCRDAAARTRTDRTCETCGTDLPAGTYARFCGEECRTASGGRTRRACRVCSTGVTGARKKAGARCCSDRCEAELAAAEATGVDLEQRKACRGCTTAKPLSEFWDAARRPDGTSTSADGKQSRCKVCVRAGARHHSRRAGARRRVRKSAREIPFTAAQRTARWSLWGGRCWICGIAEATEEDHVKPLSKGGWHCLANLRPICKPCNVRKSNRWPLTTEYAFHGYRHPHPRQGTDTHPLRAQHEVRCTHCSRPYWVPKSKLTAGTRFCSRACHYAHRAAKPHPMKTCEACGTEFRTARRSDKARFCSPECRRPARSVTRTANAAARPVKTKPCARCGTPFPKARTAARYCTTECRQAAQAERRAPVLAERATRRCAACTKPLAVDRSRGKYCDKTCAAKGASTGSKIAAVCQHCGNTFHRYRSQLRGATRFCSTSCAGDAKRTPPKRCELCDEPFKSIHAPQRFCSNSCSRLAMHAARRAQTPGAPPPSSPPPGTGKRGRPLD